RSLQLCAGLDCQVRVRAEGLAQDRSDLSMSTPPRVILRERSDRGPALMRSGGIAFPARPLTALDGQRSLLFASLRVRMTRLALLAVLPAGYLGAQTSTPRDVPSGGNGTLYVGTYGRKILVLDEATMRVRDTIHPTVGIPEL